MKLPPKWADDSLSDFIQAAFKNALATFVRKPQAFNDLVNINDIFRKIEGNLDNAGEDAFIPALFYRSHSAFLTSCRLSVSGQAVETFPLLRSCLEYALYALHINKNPSLAEIWLRRHDNEKSRRKIKESFQHRCVMKTLRDIDVALHADLSQLYEQTIDFGGHPNERGVMGSLAVKAEGDDTAVIRSQFLHGDSRALNHVLRATTQIGRGSLMVFQLIFKEQFDLLGIHDGIDSLKKVL